MERGQRTLERVFVEELQAAKGDGGAAARPVFDVFDVEKVLPQFLVADLIGRLVIMLGELADSPDIHLLGARRHAAQLQVFDHPLLEWAHDVPPWVVRMEAEFASRRYIIKTKVTGSDHPLPRQRLRSTRACNRPAAKGSGGRLMLFR